MVRKGFGNGLERVGNASERVRKWFGKGSERTVGKRFGKAPTKIFAGLFENPALGSRLLLTPFS